MDDATKRSVDDLSGNPAIFVSKTGGFASPLRSGFADIEVQCLSLRFCDDS